METINGCTIITASETPEPTYFGQAETDGAYAPPFHVHPRTDEGFYVAEGDATFLLGERELSVTAGGFVFIPRGTPHTVWNSGEGPVRGLLLIPPGNVEHEFLPADSAS